MGWVLRFRDEELEAQYVQNLNTLQCRLDVVVAVLGVFCLTVVARHAQQGSSEQRLVALALMSLLCLVLPLVAMLGGRRRYAQRRQLWLLLWLPASWHFACRAGILYSRAAADAPTLLRRLAAAAQALQSQQAAVQGEGLPPLAPVHWQRSLLSGFGSAAWGSLRSLPSQLLVRTEVVPLFMVNVGVRQVFRRHCLLHALCLAIVARYNCRRCVALAAELPWLLPAAARVASAARRLSRWVLPPPLRGLAALVLPHLAQGGRGLAAWLSGGEASSHPSCDHELLATCCAVLLFCQLLASFCAPCYLLWRAELASRRRFLACAQRRDEQLPQASSLHLLWLAPLATAACWQVAEASAGVPA